MGRVSHQSDWLCEGTGVGCEGERWQLLLVSLPYIQGEREKIGGDRKIEIGARNDVEWCMKATKKERESTREKEIEIKSGGRP